MIMGELGPVFPHALGLWSALGGRKNKTTTEHCLTALELP